MHKDIQEDPDTLERYLRHRLGPEEEADFEARYLSDQALLDELELSERLREGLRDLATVDARRESAPPNRGILSWFLTPQYAAAATVLLLISVAISTALFQQVGNVAAYPLAGTFNATRVVPLMAVRSAGGNNGGPTISTTPGEQLIFLMDAGPEPYPAFRATVSRRDAGNDAEPVWQSDGLTPGYQGLIALAIPSARLPPGDYVVTLQGRPGSGPGAPEPTFAGELRFTVDAGN